MRNQEGLEKLEIELRQRANIFDAKEMRRKLDEVKELKTQLVKSGNRSNQSFITQLNAGFSTPKRNDKYFQSAKKDSLGLLSPTKAFLEPFGGFNTERGGRTAQSNVPMLKNSEELDPIQVVRKLHKEKRDRILQKQKKELEMMKKKTEDANARQQEMFEQKRFREEDRKRSLEAKIKTLESGRISREREIHEANKRFFKIKKQKPLFLAKQEQFEELSEFEKKQIRDREMSRIEQQTIQYNQIIEHSKRYSEIKQRRIGELRE